MSYGTSIAAAKPSVGDPGPTYASTIRAWIDEVQSRLEGKVTPAGFNVNADLDFNEYNALGVDAAQFKNNSATKTGAGSARKLYVANKELYYTDGDGTAVKITSAGTVNVAGAAGFVGDYSSDTNAEADYSTANTRYRFRSNATTDVNAQVQASSVRLVGTGAGPSFGAVLAVPSLSANRTYTLPAAPPAATEALSMTSAGALAADGKHGDREMDVPLAGVYTNNGQYSNSPPKWSFNGAGTFTVTLPMKAGDRIKSITVWAREPTSQAADIKLFKSQMSGAPAATQLGTTTSTPGAGSGSVTAYDVDISATPETVAADHLYYVQVDGLAGSSGLAVHKITVTFDRP